MKTLLKIFLVACMVLSCQPKVNATTPQEGKGIGIALTTIGVLCLLAGFGAASLPADEISEITTTYDAAGKVINKYTNRQDAITCFTTGSLLAAAGTYLIYYSK